MSQHAKRTVDGMFSEVENVIRTKGTKSREYSKAIKELQRILGRFLTHQTQQA